ncbi:MAG: Peptidyl-tRNA hydrolase [Microgenomates group bacterium GW2011_GWA2_40_6]|nr:MAG: Peptidyl-tRNA hydrolase [Microgenomates group bacterium GW2011_GWA2_40_6]
MKLFFGLGNPDTKYQNSRHNVGQMVIQKLITNYELRITNSPKLLSQIAKDNNIFAISTEYMNISGISVAKVASYFKIPPADIYLIHDDLDLGVGEWKLQFDRGPAGHNGVISTIENLGTQAFWRIRIGINHPIDSTPVEDYVLQPFTKEEKVIITDTIDKITGTVIPDLIGNPKNLGR